MGGSILGGPLTVDSLEMVQRSAGNRAATALVDRQRDDPGIRPLPGSADLGSTVQRDPDDPAEVAPTPDDDPSRLDASSAEGLIRLYQTEEQVSTLWSTQATYSLAWVRSGRGSAQIRDALRRKLAAEEHEISLHWWYYGVVGSFGGPPERAAELKALIDASFVPTERLGEELSEGATRHLTRQGYLMELPVPARRRNQANRPAFRRERGEMVGFEGALVHPAVVGPLTSLLEGLRAEGARLNDESARQAQVDNGFRAPTQAEGNRYLRAIRGTINAQLDVHGDPFEYPPFPVALEAMATTELGFTGSPEHQAFERAVARSPGWTAAQARMLMRTTGLFKAPRGGSTHHSGVTVDIDWPVWHEGTVVNHSMGRARNASALASVAGRWLYEHAASYGFDTYDTGAEIWHMEWRDWQGTPADPDFEAADAG